MFMTCHNSNSVGRPAHRLSIIYVLGLSFTAYASIAVTTGTLHEAVVFCALLLLAVRAAFSSDAVRLDSPALRGDQSHAAVQFTLMVFVQ
jgi:hypothetical protein